MRRKSFKIISFLLLALLLAAGNLTNLKTAKADTNMAWNDVADHTSEDTCYEITGVTTAVTFNGVVNSGLIHFGHGTYGSVVIPNGQAACVDAAPDTSGNYLIKGWAWDDNLGLISLYCDNNGSNRGWDCNQVNNNQVITYGLTLDGAAPPSNPGELHGYAWGDGTGWISFNSANAGAGGQITYGVYTDTLDAACLGNVYDSTASGCNYFTNTLQIGDNLAWSDNVGWFNLTGVTFPWPTYPTGLQPLLTVTKINDTTNTRLNLTSILQKSDMPVAGSDGYRISLRFLKDGVLQTKADIQKYDFNGSFVWKDTVKKDQTTGTEDQYLDNNGAVTGKVFDLTKLKLLYDNVNGYTFDVKSVAPTTNGNMYTDGTDTASNESFVTPATTVSDNRLQLASFNLSVSVKDDNSCPIGNAPNCTPMPLASNWNLDFRPPVEVSKFDLNEGDGVTKNYLEGTVNQTNNLDISTTCSVADCSGANITFNYGSSSSYYPNSVDKTKAADGPIVLKIGENVGGHVSNIRGVGLWGGDFTYGYNYLSALTQLSFEPVFFVDKAKSSDTVVKDPYIYSTISYNGATYYSAKLPRVDNGALINPVLTIKGNVYSTGIFNAQTNDTKVVKSLGDVSTNILRDQIAKNVATITAGVSKSLDGGGSITSDWSVSGGGAKQLLKDSSGKYKVYYFKCSTGQDVKIDPGSYDTDRSIIAVGCNVHINRSLMAAVSSNGSKPKLGIIVLKDLVNNVGGNVYIDPSVTDIQANIFADGSVFSDNNVGPYNTDGSPVWGSEHARRSALVNQLYIEGSIASLNTIGGATKSPPISGDGTILCDSEGSYNESGCTTGSVLNGGRQQARNFDLNFLRYFGKGCPIASQQGAVNVAGTCDSSTRVTIGSGSQSKLLQSIDPNNEDAVYVKFDPPSPTLPGFTNPGQGLDLQQRIQ